MKERPARHLATSTFANGIIKVDSTKFRKIG